MTKRLFSASVWLRVVIPGAAVLQFNGCGLSDQQLTGIWQSVLSTALNATVTTIIQAFFTLGNNTTA